MAKKRLMIGVTVFLITLMLFPLNIFAINKNITVDEKENNATILPNTENFQTNEDFKKYDPAYPKKEQFGDYVLQIPELKDRLTFSINNDNQMVGTLYAPGISKQGGWKDATKKWGNYDFGLCFAASSSNLISWYLNRYTQLHPEDHNTYVMHEESVFDRFRNGWDSSKGGNQTEALSWYFTGGFPSGNSQAQDNQLTGKEQGGYLRNKIYNNKSNRWADVSILWNPREKFTVYGGYDDNKFPFIEEVGGMSNGGAFSNLRGFSDQILRQLHYGVCTISILTDQSSGGSGHAITLWGADYDVNTGLVTALHVTDSDDYRGKFTVPIQKGNDNSPVRMIKYPYNPPIGNAQNFTRIRDSIVLYAPEVVKPINKPTLNVKVEGQKIIDLDKKDSQIFQVKTTGHESSYVPEYQIEFKNEKGIKLPANQISTKYDIFNREFIVIIKNEKILPGNYTAEITEKYTNQKFEESFEFYKENQTYTVTFHANQGNGIMDVQQFEMGVEQALSNNQFSRIGYTFKGWSKQPNGTVQFQDGQTVTNLSADKNSNIDLYAVWDANTYTITFHSSGATGVMNSQTMTYDKSSPLSKNTFTKEGYTFKGWSTLYNGPVVYLDESDIINLTNKADGEVILYAIWEENVINNQFGYKINVTDQVITIGENFDPLNIIDVYDENNKKVILDQSNIIENTVNINVAGIYHITYQITDKKDMTITKTIQVTVKDNKPEQPSTPNKPEQPSTPNKPDKPSTPDNPEQSNTPNKQENPSAPNQPEQPDNHVKPNELLNLDNKKKVPSTGDRANISLISTILISSIGLITIILNKKRYD